MHDPSARTINYLRVSITDRCDLRCRYCMPQEGIDKRTHDDILRVQELLPIVEQAAQLGFSKVRITGGEPLVRRGVLDICEGIARIPGIDTLCMTTNATALAPMAKPLRDAGVQRLNISLDTLRADRYAAMTRGGDIRRVLLGLEAARAAGFAPPKVNVVLIGGFNTDEIPDFIELTRSEALQVRFIELMPLGECARWDRSRFVSAQEVLRQAPALRPIGAQGVAEVYQMPGYQGSIGLIRPLSGHICPQCNRMRLTADGHLKPCLHSGLEIPLRGLAPPQINARLREAIEKKPAQHHLHQSGSSETTRLMHRIGG